MALFRSFLFSNQNVNVYLFNFKQVEFKPICQYILLKCNQEMESILELYLSQL